MKPGRPRGPIKHSTEYGYKEHLRRDGPGTACPECLAEHVRVKRRQRTNPGRQVPAGLPDMTWQAGAACTGDENRHIDFFPSNRAAAGPALAVCVGCPVMDECLGFAVETRSPGVWGGRYVPVG